MHRLKAEALARSQCDAGLTAYLAQQHSKHRSKTTAYGLLGGLVGSVVLMIWGKNSMKGMLSFIPLGVGILGGLATGLATQDDGDSAREDDFREVCAQYEAEDEECDCEEGDDCGCEDSL